MVGLFGLVNANEREEKKLFQFYQENNFDE